MSRKYQRIKEADQMLWPPLRRLLQAFSSITLAVILLTGVALFCALGSVPIGPLALAGSYAVLAMGGAAVGWLALRRGSAAVMLVGMTLGAAAGLGAAYWLWPAMQHAAGWDAWLDRYGGLTVYKLPALEMTELQFYSTWPMKLLLVLFIINMVVATIRRIEFHWLNLGVLTVHTGIVALAIGAALYGQLKVEGDTLLIDPRFGGRPVAHFYDSTHAAVYIDRGDRRLFIPLTALPRYHDRRAGELSLPLDAHPAFAQLLDEQTQASVVGFIAQGDLVPTWTPPDPGETPAPNPAIDLEFGHEDQFAQRLLVARSQEPDERRIDMGVFSIGYLVDVDPLWFGDLTAEIGSEHGLVVDIPAADYRAVHEIQQGQTLALGDTGYTLRIDELMPRYPFPVMTEGFVGSAPSVAKVTITRPDQSALERWVMHPFAQLTQDFVADPQGGRPKRQAPSDDIRLAYIDASATRFWVTQPGSDSDRGMHWVMRARGGAVAKVPLAVGQELDVPFGDHPLTIRLKAFYPSVVREMQPRATPAIGRDPNDLGRFGGSLVCVELRRGDWTKRAWLPFVQYVELSERDAGRARVEIPELGEVSLSYSRVRYPLPYHLTLVDFEHETHAGSTVSADFRSTVRVDFPRGDTQTADIHMNHPLMVSAGDADLALVGCSGWAEQMRFGRLKFWQSGWDPQRQSYTILGVGNNVGIYVIAVGGILMGLGIPWAFYVKPAVLKARKARPRTIADESKSIEVTL